MLYLSDFVNQRNIKRAVKWFIKNPRILFITLFMLTTIYYKHYSSYQSIKKWTGEIEATFRSVKESGAIEFVINGTLMDINITNYILPKLYETTDEDHNKECEFQLHFYVKNFIINKLQSAKSIKIKFDKDTDKSVLENTFNSGFHAQIIYDGNNLNNELVAASLVCSIAELKKLKLSFCNWCAIMARAGLQNIKK